jgi:TonB family protein
MKSKLLFILFISVFTLQQAFAQGNAYKAGKKDGVWNYFGSNKVLLARHFYNEGVKTGIWEFYTIDGSLWWTYNFNTSTATYLKENTGKGFYAYLGSDGKWIKKQPDKPAIWLSSQSQWNNFLVNNLKYPEEAATIRVPGKVEIRVYLDEQGNVTGYKIGNDVEASLNKEALRVAKLYKPEFVPASNNGNNVKSMYTLYVSYKLADSR